MLILYSRMEELITLQYGNFTILGEQTKVFTPRTRYSNRVANWTLRGQFYPNKLRREHRGWNTAQCQEWGLFLLEHLLHNTASMRRKEHKGAPEPHKLRQPKWWPWSTPIRTLLGSTDVEILKIAEQVYQGVWVVVPSVLPHWQQKCINELHQELARPGL